MPESDSTQARPLPRELERALQQATGRTLESLALLTIALRQHVDSERSHGVAFSELELELRALVTRCEARASRSLRNRASDRSLSDQVVQWSGIYFHQSD